MIYEIKQKFVLYKDLSHIYSPVIHQKIEIFGNFLLFLWIFNASAGSILKLTKNNY